MYNDRKFELLVGTTRTVVTPAYDDSVTVSISKVDSEYYSRNNMSGSFTFFGADFDIINNAAYNSEFKLVLSILRDNSFVELSTGYFTKTNCEFDEDHLLITVQVESYDRYTEILNGIEREYDLDTLKIERQEVTTTQFPVLQFYIPTHQYLTSLSGGSVSEIEVLDFAISEADLEAVHHFGVGKRLVYIAGVGDLTIDCAGEYVDSGVTEYTRTDNAYTLTYVSTTQGSRWIISGGYQSPFVANAESIKTGLIFTNTTNLEQVQVRVYDIYVRALTNKDTFNLAPTLDLPIDDIVPASSYKKAIPFPVSTFVPSDLHSSTGGFLGTFSDASLHFAGEYFEKPTFPSAAGIETLFPVTRSEWVDFSIWFYHNPTFLAALQDEAEEVIQTDCLLLSDVISYIVNDLDSAITHSADSAHSLLLYTTLLNSHTLIITAKNNIITGTFDQPADRGIIKLSDILIMLKTVYGAYWDITDNNEFRIEAAEFYHRGGNYTTNIVSADISNLNNVRYAQKWGLDTNKYSYNKNEMPERITRSWMDDTSDFFNGLPILMLDDVVQKDTPLPFVATRFTTDIDFIYSNPSNVANDGFVLIAGILNSAGYSTEVVESEGVNYQNGSLSFTNLAATYFRNVLPSLNINLNGIDTTALIVERNRVQNVTLPFYPDRNILQLITGTLGQGQPNVVVYNISNGSSEITLNLDNE